MIHLLSLSPQISQLESANVENEKEALKAENEKLKKEVASLVQKLTQLEKAKGVTQVFAAVKKLACLTLNLPYKVNTQLSNKHSYQTPWL